MYSRCSFHCVHILMPSSANVEIRQTRAKIGSTCFPFRATWNGRKRMHSEVDTNLLNKTIFHCSWAFQNVKWRWQCVMQASKNQTRKWFGFGKVNRWEKAWPRRGFGKVRNVSASPWPSITRGIEKVLFTHSAVSSALEIHSFCVAILDVIEYFGSGLVRSPTQPPSLVPWWSAFVGSVPETRRKSREFLAVKNWRKLRISSIFSFLLSASGANRPFSFRPSFMLYVSKCVPESKK